jgi:hypothetical protein
MVLLIKFFKERGNCRQNDNYYHAKYL